MFFMDIRNGVQRTDKLVFLQELELPIYFARYGVLYTLGNQYIVCTVSCLKVVLGLKQTYPQYHLNRE